MKPNITPEGEPVRNNCDSQNHHLQADAIGKAHEAHQQALNKLFSQIHSPDKMNSDPDGLAKSLQQYNEPDGTVYADSMDELNDKLAPLPDGGDGGDNESGDSDGHQSVFGLVNGTNGAVVNVILPGQSDSEDVLDALIEATFHLRKSIRGEAPEEPAKVEDPLTPSPEPAPKELPNVSIHVSLPQYTPYDDICILARGFLGSTVMEVVKADRSLDLTNPDNGEVVASEKATVVDAEHEFCFEYMSAKVPPGNYIARCTDFFGRTEVSGMFEVERDTLRTVKSFCKKSGWGFSTVHKAIGDGTIPGHLVVEKTKHCNKRRVYMSADQFLLNSGKRKCRQHKRPNRRTKTA